MKEHNIAEKGYGERLRNLRTKYRMSPDSKRRLTQNELSQKLKIAFGSINRAENNHSIPSPINRQKLADFFETDEWLYSLEKGVSAIRDFPPSLELKAAYLIREHPKIIETLYDECTKISETSGKKNLLNPLARIKSSLHLTLIFGFMIIQCLSAHADIITLILSRN